MKLDSSRFSLAQRKEFWLAAVALVAILGGALFFLLRGRSGPALGLTFTAKRGPLDITVLEGGSIQAAESQEAKCEVRVGYQGTKILKIVEEGYLVTEEDIRTNKVLVELDSSDLQKQLAQQEIQYSQAVASLTDAQQAHEIQLNQNLSDIKAAEQKVRFARMDFDKFLGDRVAEAVLDELGLEKVLETEQTNAHLVADGAASDAVSVTHANLVLPTPGANSEAPIDMMETTPAAPQEPRLNTEQNGNAGQTGPQTPAASAHSSATVARASLSTNQINIDFSRFAKIELLGDGEAKQKLRELEDTLQVALKEESQAQANLEGTRRLIAKGFVTQTDLQQNEIAYENARLKVQRARTARDLYLKYECIKTAEDWLSKYAEAVRELNRARKAAISRTAQTEAKWRSAQAQFQVQSRQLKEIKEQLAKCTITAQKPGLVVYGGGSDDPWMYGGQERIREGATVRERQSIITIPDMSKMIVKVKIPEAYIKRVQKGQQARITVDAFPDTVLHGEVSKVGVLPDSQNRWMNPDLKVYLTTIAIEGSYDWIKPGMSAKVEIIVDRLADVVYVPVQAVNPREGLQFCYVVRGKRAELLPVEIGQFNDSFIEIKKGLKEGDAVLLRRPETVAPENAAPPPTPGPSAATSRSTARGSSKS